MCIRDRDIPIQAIRKQIASSIDIIVQLERLRDRSRRVTAIAEVLDCTEDAYILNPIFEFHEKDNLVKMCIRDSSRMIVSLSFNIR